jgi:hypothetical protein
MPPIATSPVQVHTVHDRTGEVDRQVDGRARACQADDDECASRAEQVTEPLEASGGVDVVQRGDSCDEVE